MSDYINGAKWDWIERFDCRVFSAKYFEGGGFWTSFPISPNEYLVDRKTKAKVEFFKGIDSTVFTIVDDWGRIHQVAIPNKYTSLIENAMYHAKQINEAIAYVRR